MHNDAKRRNDIDLVALQLRKLTEVPSYAGGALKVVSAPFTDVYAEPVITDASPNTQLLFGEPFVVYEAEEGWAWGQALIDDYVGYVRIDDLIPADEYATHRVSHIRTYVYPEPSVNSAPEALLSLNSRVTVVEEGCEGFLRLSDGAFVPAVHLTSVTAPSARTPADVAEMFLYTPFLRGGRTSIGVDDAALVQLAITACNAACPRESDLQEMSVGYSVTADDLERNDLVFWRGHVGIMADRTHLIHADELKMCVRREPLIDVIERMPYGVRSMRRILL